ncbi:MAG: FHA domain-containing protein, partial [Calditrichaeota bacterium]
MPKLILKHKAEVLKELQLKNTKAMYSIGSDEENDICIVDKRVSARHAAIERHGTRFFIRDLNSAFGTYFYGRKLEEPAELHSGDQIQIADFTLAFENPLESSAQDNGSPPQPSYRETEFSPGGEAFANQTEALTLEKESSESQPLDNGVETSAKEKPAPADVESRKEMAPYFLLAIYGPYAGKKFQLKYGETRIGRDSKFNDIIIRENMHGEIDPSISRRHATITYHDHSFFVMDKRSKTRTYVNQLEVPEDEEIALEHGDEIEIVSDQKSTIFRFVPEGNWDFSPPKKAGTWWVRYQPKLLRGAAVVAIAVGLILGIGGWLSYSNIVQKPEPFKLEMTKWAIPGPSKRSARPATSRPAAASFRPVAAIADFTGNGYVDLAMLSGQQTPMLISGRKRRRTWRLDNLKVDPQYPLLAADLNNNHLKDLILVTTNGQVIAVDGKYGAEIFSSPYFQPPFSGAPVVGDFDADGWPDVAIAEQSGQVHIGFNRLVEMEWKTFDSGVGLMAPLTAADLDRDGDAEILCGSERGLILIIDAAQLKIAGTVDINEELNKALGTF